MDVAAAIRRERFKLGLNRRRGFATFKNTFAGLGLGFFIHILNLTAVRLGDQLSWAFLVLAALPVAALARSSRYTCARQPAAPRWIATGVALGVLFSHVFASHAVEASAMMWAVATVSAIGLPWLAHFYGMRGLAESFGQPVKGVGDLCATCGYDLGSTPSGWPCPECGSELRYDSRKSSV